jgi:hypothetical protein
VFTSTSTSTSPFTTTDPGNPGNPGNPSSTVTKGYHSVEKEVTLNRESSDCFTSEFSTRVTGVTNIPLSDGNPESDYGNWPSLLNSPPPPAADDFKVW